MESVIPSARVDVLVFGAHPPDLRGLRNRVGERLDGKIANLHVTGKTVGVGVGVAGASAAKRVFQLAPRAVVQLGTCGIYPGAGDYQPYDVIVASKLKLVDLAVLTGRARWPEPMQAERDTHPHMTSGLASAGRRVFTAPVACTYAVTTDDAVAAEIPKLTGCHAENLEGFSIAHACHLAEIPFASVLAATHVVGSNAHSDWQKHERQATITAAEILVSWICMGAPGLPHDT